jgi:hypothetical protein
MSNWRLFFKTSQIKKYLTGFLLISWLLTGCASSAPQTATPDVAALSTEAVATVYAELTLSPAPSPIPSVTPTETPPTLATPTRKECTQSTFISDVTIPDGTKMTPGQQFTKTWRVQNSGVCPWTTAFKLDNLSGEAMGGSSIAMPNVVQPGQSVDLSVNMTAPAKAGNLTGGWRLRDDKGQEFGVKLTVVIDIWMEGMAEANTPYLVTTEDGKDAVFLPYPNDLTHGDLTTAEGLHLPVKFTDLKDPQAFFIQQETIEYLRSFSFDPERERFYFAVVLMPEVNDVQVRVAAIYQIIPDAPGYIRLWANSIDKRNDFYPGYYGSAGILQVKGEYLVVQIAPCFGCSPVVPNLVLVLNSVTRAERVLGTVGNVNLDLDQNRVTYQELVEKKVPCDGGENCFSDGNGGGYMINYVPGGDVLSADLP